MATRLPSILSQLSFPVCVGWFPCMELNIGTTQGKVEKRAEQEMYHNMLVRMLVFVSVCLPVLNPANIHDNFAH